MGPAIALTIINNDSSTALTVKKLKATNEYDSVWGERLVPARNFGEAPQITITDAQQGECYAIIEGRTKSVIELIRVIPIAFVLNKPVQIGKPFVDKFERTPSGHWLRGAQELQQLSTSETYVILYGPDYGIELPLKGNRCTELEHGGATVTVHTDWAVTPLIANYAVQIAAIKLPVQNLRSNRLPNVEANLFSFNIDDMDVFDIDASRKMRLFNELGSTDTNYYERAAYYIQQGLSFDTLHQQDYASHTRTIASASDYAEVWNISIALKAGGDAKKKDDPKTDAKGALSFAYSESKRTHKSQKSISTASYTFTQLYEVALDDPLIMPMNDKFKDDVFGMLDAPDESFFTGIVATLEKQWETCFIERPWADDSSPNKMIADERKAFADLQELQKQLRDSAHWQRALKFTKKWGTHYASKVTYGGARWLTLHFNEATQTKFQEQGIDIRLEADAFFNNGLVPGGVSGSSSRKVSESFSRFASEQKEAWHAIGSQAVNDMGSAQPIKVELAPLSDLVNPYCFGPQYHGRWKELDARRRLLRILIHDMYRFDDVGSIVNELLLFEFVFRGFGGRQVSHTRDLFGSVKLGRPADVLQEDRGYPEGKLVWGRENKEGAAVTMTASYIEPPDKGLERAYCFVRKPKGNSPSDILKDIKFTMSCDIRERHGNADSTYVAAGNSEFNLKDIYERHSLPTANIDDPWRDGDWDNHDVWQWTNVGGDRGIDLYYRCRQTRWQWLPGWLREEVESRIVRN